MDGTQPWAQLRRTTCVACWRRWRWLSSSVASAARTWTSWSTRSARTGVSAGSALITSRSGQPIPGYPM